MEISIIVQIISTLTVAILASFGFYLKLEKRLSKIETRLDIMDSQDSNFKQTVEKLEGKMDKLTESIVELNLHIAKISNNK